MTAHFHFLEDIALADCAFEASGATPSELFRAAAQAVIETMANPSMVSPSWSHTVEQEDAELGTLLFDWLAEIVYLKDAKGVVFAEVTTDVRHDSDRNVWKLHGTVSGEPIDQARHELRADIKAVTKHLYEVKQDGNCWTARIVLDI